MSWISRLLCCIIRCFRRFPIFGPGLLNCIRTCMNGQVVDSDVTTGTTGSYVQGQSFNETRAVDATVFTPFDLIVEQLSLKGLNLGSSALVGARVYDSVTQACIASSNVTVPPGTNLAVTIPLSTTLASGKSYRIGFYVQTTSPWLGSGNFFLPAFSPYVETTRLFQINAAYEAVADTFPINPNLAVPQMTIQTRATCLP